MRPSLIVIALCAVSAAPAMLPTAKAQARPDPADPAAPVPSAAYRSAFADFRPLGEEAVGDWRASNEEVRRIGGWREYAREAQAPEGKPAPDPASPAPVAPVEGTRPGHAGHGMHGGMK